MKTEVLFFDVNETLVDLSKVQASVAKALEGDDNVVSLWFETMLHYSLVATFSDRYENFGDIGASALVMLAKQHDISLGMEKAKQVLAPIQTTPPHPEVAEALRQFKKAKYEGQATL